MKKIYVAEDFPAEIARKGNRLRPILKGASRIQQYEKSISMKNDKLLFSGELLSVDELQKLPEAIHPRTLSEVRSGDVMIFGDNLSEYYELSNYFKCSVTYKKRKFNSSEQAYQYSKTTLFNDVASAESIMRSSRPAHQKFIASKVSGFDYDQ